MKLHRSIHLVTAVVLFVACSQQGQGERCVYANNNADCASGLICTAAQDLVEYDSAPLYAADRCCPETLTQATDPRCAKSGGIGKTSTSTGGTTGAGGDSASSGGDSTGSAGEASIAQVDGTAGTPSSLGAGGDSAGSGGDSAGSGGDSAGSAGASGSGQ